MSDSVDRGIHYTTQTQYQSISNKKDTLIKGKMSQKA